MGGVAIAVALDTSNAFNSLPWDTIGQALIEHRVPLYLRRILRDYLRDRKLEYVDEHGIKILREVRRGVPQGLILGPLLWNVGYDGVLRKSELPPDCAVVCYADDTVVLAAGNNWEETLLKANEAVADVVEQISDLDLKVALAKTEAIAFHGAHARRLTGMEIVVANTRVEVKSHMKYLGLVLDSQWNFEEHFRRLAPRLQRASMSLSGLLPNLGGPCGGVRRLSTNVITSMATYASPVWSRETRRSRKIQRALHEAQRGMAIPGYRQGIPHDLLRDGHGARRDPPARDNGRDVYRRLRTHLRDQGTGSHYASPENAYPYTEESHAQNDRKVAGMARHTRAKRRRNRKRQNRAQDKLYPRAMAQGQERTPSE